MSKHTPGPWNISWARSGQRLEGARIRAKELDLVCYVPSDRIGPTDEDPGERMSDEQQANARLIAAAPELLEALEGFVRDLERGPWGADGPPITHPALQRYEQAKGAIAKAEGR